MQGCYMTPGNNFQDCYLTSGNNQNVQLHIFASWSDWIQTCRTPAHEALPVRRAACCDVPIMAASQLAAIMRATAQSHGAQPYAMGRMLAESLLELYGVVEKAFDNRIEGIEETLQLTVHGAAAEEQEPQEAKNDRLAAGLLLRNVRQYFDMRLSTAGTRPAALQQQAGTISQALFSDEIVAKKLLSAVCRVTHISRKQFLAGGRLQEDNAASLSVSDVRSSNHLRFVRTVWTLIGSMNGSAPSQTTWRSTSQPNPSTK